jgi:hypothetical protein
MNEEQAIPEMTDPLGKYWGQPDANNILIDDTHALMAAADFDKLKEYSQSQPSGVYVGKMWKSCYRGDKWYLNWWGFSDDPNMCSGNFREIIVV